MTDKNEYIETEIIERIKRKKNNNSDFYDSLTEEEKEAFEIYVNLRKEKYEEKAKNDILLPLTILTDVKTVEVEVS